ncbi:MAG: Holliday junction branch migration protein RuvA [Candidatus Eisenbacteria bacterium]
MIAHVEGILAEKSPARAVVDVAGVGYDLSISLNTYEDLPGEGMRVRLVTHPYLREETIQLYGFSTAAERELFRVLLGVPGVGPKLALAILSSMKPERFRRAVVDADTAHLSRIPGIGKKSAQRLVVELRSKFEGGEGSGLDGMLGGAGGVAEEARLALEALGIKSDKASKAIERVLVRRGGEEPSVEDLVREALSGV